MRRRTRAGRASTYDRVAAPSAADALANVRAGVTADALDKEQIDQLHAATLQVSSNCFELKKLCATVLAAASTLILTLTDRKLDAALFVGGLIVVLIFWSADAQSYYIQAKLRARMKDLQGARTQRLVDPAGYTAEGIGLPINLATDRWRRVRKAFFNASMLYYCLVALVVGGAWVAYGCGLIR